MPTEERNLALPYPDIPVESTYENDNDDELNELIEYMQTAQENDHKLAGESLVNSKSSMKKQYDKRLNPITYKNISESDEVLIENVYQKKKGGKFQDKWLGPYPVAKVNRRTINVFRNKSIQRVKRSKVKLWKRPAAVHSSDTTPTNPPQLEITDELSADTLSQQSTFFGAEETVLETVETKYTKELMLEMLNSMKSDIINSIKTNTPLPELHRELHLRRDMPFKELFNWRTNNYPSNYTIHSPDDQLETTFVMSNLLAQWYLDSFDIKIPEYQYTDEDYEFSSQWSTKSFDYSTKVLIPVVQQLIAISKTSHNNVPIILGEYSLSQQMEDICATWGGQHEGIQLVNTCTVDNFITLQSLHSDILPTAFQLSSLSLSPTLETMWSFISSCKFNELLLWLAPQLGAQLVEFQYNLFGFEGIMVTLLSKFGLWSDSYKVLLQCWGCCCESEKRLNLTFVTTFKENCQATINHQISASFSCLKCRDPKANIECMSKNFVQLSPLFILEVGHLDSVSKICENDIEDEIYISHNGKRIRYSLLGYTIHTGLHFFNENEVT